MNLWKPKAITVVVAVGNLILEELNFVDKINAKVNYSEDHCNLSLGQRAKAFILATFTDMRIPLTHIQDRTADMDLEYLLRADYDKCDINAFNMGRALECIGEQNVNNSYETLAVAAIEKYKIPIERNHSDTSTISFHGEYDISKMNLTDEEKEEILKIEKGYNKDGRAGDNQVIIGKMVTNTGIPLTSRVLDGVTSDIEWNRIAIDCYEQLQTRGINHCTYVADCKLITQELVERLNAPDRRIPFVSRCPENFNELQAKRTKAHAYKKDTWIDFGQVGTGKNASNYRGSSHTETIFGTPMRLLVLESTALCEKAKKSFAKRQAAVEPLVKAIEKKSFACFADAQKEFNRFAKLKDLRFFDVTPEITEKLHEKWPRGRRTITTKPKITSVFTIKVSVSTNTNAYDEFIRNESSFVLISNIAEETMNDTDLLKTYKGQHTVESTFRHFKSPSLASVIYLKNPKRIEAMTMLLSVALLIRAIVQYRLRDGLKKHLQENPGAIIRAGWGGKKLESPTFHLFYEHTINCKFERIPSGEYTFDWPNVETRATVGALLMLMGLSISTILL